MRTKPLLFLILFLALLIRLLYYFHAPGIIVQSDTYGYYYLGRTILSGDLSFIFGPSRTPVYPLFLNLIAFFSGNFGKEIFSDGFNKAMHVVILIQSFFGLFSLIILYELLLLLKIKPLFAYLYTLFTAFNIMVFGWERILMTESLNVFFLVTTTFLLIKLIQNPKKKYFIFLFLLFSFGFLLKPVYLFFPLPLLLIICLYHRRKSVFKNSLVIITFFFLLVFSYFTHNHLHFHYRGINQVSEINLLGKILKYNLPIEAGQEYKYLYQSISDYRKVGGEPMPYRFLEKFDPVYWKNMKLFADLAGFNRKVIMANLFQFLLFSIMELPTALLETSEIIVLRGVYDSSASFFFHLLFAFYKKLQILTLIILPAYPVIFFLFFKKTMIDRTINEKLTIMFLLGTISFYQIFFAVFFSYGEFSRLIAPVQPILYLFSLYWWWKLFRAAIFILKR